MKARDSSNVITQTKAHRNMERGTVKWFDQAKGYGFIQRETGDGDIFVHISGIRMHSGQRETLLNGQLVEYSIGKGRKGIEAKDVHVVG